MHSYLGASPSKCSQHQVATPSLSICRRALSVENLLPGRTSPKGTAPVDNRRIAVTSFETQTDTLTSSVISQGRGRGVNS